MQLQVAFLSCIFGLFILVLSGTTLCNFGPIQQFIFCTKNWTHFLGLLYLQNTTVRTYILQLQKQVNQYLNLLRWNLKVTKIQRIYIFHYSGENQWSKLKVQSKKPGHHHKNNSRPNAKSNIVISRFGFEAAPPDHQFLLFRLFAHLKLGPFEFLVQQTILKDCRNKMILAKFFRVCLF